MHLAKIQNVICQAKYTTFKIISQEKQGFLISSVLSTMLGIIFYFRYNINLQANHLLATIAFLIILCLYFKNLKIPRNLCILAIFLNAGMLAAKYRVENLDTGTLRKKIFNEKYTGKVDYIFQGAESDKVIISDTKLISLKEYKLPKNIQFKYNKNDHPNIHFNPGDIIEFSADIYPLPKAVYPGAYNFSDIAKFKNIGALGKMNGEIKILSFAKENIFNALIKSVRIYIDNLFIAKMSDKDRSGVAMALFTANKGYIGEELSQDVKKSGLSHLLAISGIHISIIAVTSFLIIRKLLSFSQYITLKYDIKKISAIVAVFISFVHLQISGVSISATRSFTMFSLGLLAIILDRHTNSIRIVAITFIVLILQKPEGLFDPSLQMSFMAVLGLIGGMRSLATYLRERYADSGRFVKLMLYFFVILVASKIATFATFPYSVYHFNQYSNIGLLSNIPAVPLIEFGVIPLGVIAIITSILNIGIEYIPIKIMEFLIYCFIELSRYCAKVQWSYSMVSEMPMKALFFYTLGLIMLLGLQTKLRYAGIFALIAAGILHNHHPKIMLIIGRNPNDIIFSIKENHDIIYYARKNLSSDFIKNIWLGRIGIKDIQAAPDNMITNYFKNQGGIDTFSNEYVKVYFLQNFTPENLCLDISQTTKQRIFILDGHNTLNKNFCPQELSGKKAYIIKKWNMLQNGAFVLRY